MIHKRQYTVPSYCVIYGTQYIGTTYCVSCNVSCTLYINYIMYKQFLLTALDQSKLPYEFIDITLYVRREIHTCLFHCLFVCSKTF